MSGRMLINSFSDPVKYIELENFWAETWTKILSKFPDAGEWISPFFGTHFANGEPFQDGNPIFSAACEPRKLVVRIIQREGSTGGITCWNDCTMDGLSELVINLSLNKCNLKLAIELIEDFIEDGFCTLVEMEDIIEAQQDNQVKSRIVKSKNGETVIYTGLVRKQKGYRKAKDQELADIG